MNKDRYQMDKKGKSIFQNVHGYGMVGMNMKMGQQMNNKSFFAIPRREKEKEKDKMKVTVDCTSSVDYMTGVSEPSVNALKTVFNLLKDVPIIVEEISKLGLIGQSHTGTTELSNSIVKVNGIMDMFRELVPGSIYEPPGANIETGEFALSTWVQYVLTTLSMWWHKLREVFTKQAFHIEMLSDGAQIKEKTDNRNTYWNREELDELAETDPSLRNAIKIMAQFGMRLEKWLSTSNVEPAFVNQMIGLSENAVGFQPTYVKVLLDYMNAHYADVMNLLRPGRHIFTTGFVFPDKSQMIKYLNNENAMAINYSARIEKHELTCLGVHMGLNFVAWPDAAALYSMPTYQARPLPTGTDGFQLLQDHNDILAYYYRFDVGSQTTGMDISKLFDTERRNWYIRCSVLLATFVASSDSILAFESEEVDVYIASLKMEINDNGQWVKNTILEKKIVRMSFPGKSPTFGEPDMYKIVTFNVPIDPDQVKYQQGIVFCMVHVSGGNWDMDGAMKFSVKSELYYEWKPLIVIEAVDLEYIGLDGEVHNVQSAEDTFIDYFGRILPDNDLIDPALSLNNYWIQFSTEPAIFFREIFALLLFYCRDEKKSINIDLRFVEYGLTEVDALFDVSSWLLSEGPFKNLAIDKINNILKHCCHILEKFKEYMPYDPDLFTFISRVINITE